MKKIILLNKDHSIQIVKENKFKYNKNIKYVLIPIVEFDINSYLMLKPNKYMEFTKASVEISMIYTNVDIYNDEFYRDEFPKQKKEFTSLIEFYNYIHTIDRLSYINHIINCQFSYEKNLEIMNIKEINIILYNNKDIIYKLNFINELSIEFEEVMDESIKDIKSIIKDIYKCKNKDLSEKILYISDHNNQWALKDDIKEDGIYTINLFHTNLLYFLDKNTITFLNKSIQSIFVSHYLIDLSDEYADILDFKSFIRNYDEDDEFEYDYFTILLYSINDYIEYFLYIDYINMMLRFIFEYIIFSETKSDFDIYFYIKIYLKNRKEIKVKFNKDTLYNLKDIINIVERKNRE